MLRNKTDKKMQSHEKDPIFFKKIAIKRMKIKIKIKNKLNDNYKFFIRG